MIKNILTLGLASVILLSCEEKKVEESPLIPDAIEAPSIELEVKNKPVLFNYMSTGCPGCGSWGAPTFEAITNREKDAVVPIGVHIKYGDPMITDVSNAIASNRIGQFFTPQIWVNNTNGVILTGGSISGTASVNKMNDDIDAFINIAPEILVGTSSIVNDDKIYIRYKTKAQQDLTGDYYVGVYLLENKIYAKQNSGSQDPFEHNYVIRTSNKGGFGTMLSAEHLETEAVMDEQIDANILPEWKKENLYAAVIVWRKEEDNYLVVNANNNLVH
ncbi:Omp28-related outer membrane protein [Bacteroidia bacterium]|nr:Omp28-related outer membrane protein [Bacteroidia bacterium]